MLRTFRALLLITTCALAGVLAACGSSSSTNVKDTLNQAFSTPIKSAKVNLDLSLSLNGVKQLNGPVKLTLQGPYESGQGKTIPKADWDIGASASGQNFSAGFVSTGDNAWVKFQGQSYELGTQAVAQINQQIKQAAAKKQNKGLGQFGIHPRAWLTDAKDEGDSKVAGADTTHVSAALDVAKFLDDVNALVQKTGGTLPGGTKAPQLTQSQKDQVRKVVGNPRFDVYVGKNDHVIRRLSADLSFTIPQNKQAQLGGMQSGTVSFSIEFADVGNAQTIAAPKNAKPITELTGKLGGLGGALGGGSSGTTTSPSGTSSGSTSTPSAATFKKYSDCLNKADPSDAVALQKCSDLVK